MTVRGVAGVRGPTGARPLLGMPSMIEVIEIDPERDFDVAMGAVPNRLYGTEINGFGEAI